MRFDFVEMFLAFSVAANIVQAWNHFSLTSIFLRCTYETDEEDDEDGKQ